MIKGKLTGKFWKKKKNRIVTTKYSEKNIINQMKSDLQNCEIEYNAKIKNEIQSNESAHDTQFNNNQIELSLKTRQVEDIRDSIKQENENYEKRVKEKKNNYHIVKKITWGVKTVPKKKKIII